MLRRGLVRVGVVVRGVAPANDSQGGAEDLVDAGWVGHAVQGGPALAPCQPREGGYKSTAQTPTLTADAALIARLRVDGHTCDSLAAALGCSRTLAANLLAGRRRWTDHQRAKLRGKAA